MPDFKRFLGIEKVHRNSIKITVDLWSEWRDLNPRHPAPKAGALPTALHPDIQFLSLYHGGGENQRFFCLWSFMWSKPLLCRFRQSGKVPQAQAPQGFAAFRLALSRIPPRRSQSRRAAPGGAFRQGSCAAPGQVLFYYTITREKCKWEWRRKCGRLETSEPIGSGAQRVFCPN